MADRKPTQRTSISWVIALGAILCGVLGLGMTRSGIEQAGIIVIIGAPVIGLAGLGRAIHEISSGRYGVAATIGLLLSLAVTIAGAILARIVVMVSQAYPVGVIR